jgi:hypothetical protein
MLQPAISGRMHVAVERPLTIQTSFDAEILTVNGKCNLHDRTHSIGGNVRILGRCSALSRSAPWNGVFEVYAPTGPVR